MPKIKNPIYHDDMGIEIFYNLIGFLFEGFFAFLFTKYFYHESPYV